MWGMRWGPSISLWGWGKKVLLTFPQFKYSNAPKKAHFSFTLDESVECHQNFCFFLMWPNFFLIRCAKIFSSIFRGARKTLKNCANYTNFTNLVMVCEEWGEEKNVVRMRSSPPWPMRFEVTFLNFFSMRNEVRTSTRSKRGQMSVFKYTSLGIPPTCFLAFWGEFLGLVWVLKHMYHWMLE